MQNGFSSTQTTAEIKAAAVDTVDRATKGFSPLSMLRQAKSFIQHAGEEEKMGHLPEAFSYYAKAAHLVRKTMASPEHQNEKSAGAQGVLHKEIREFLEAEGKELTQKFAAVGNKLKSMESKSSPQLDGPITKSGGSIADRVRSLQESTGMPIETTKWISICDLPSVPKTQPGRAISTKPQQAKLDDTILSPTVPPSIASPLLSSTVSNILPTPNNIISSTKPSSPTLESISVIPTSQHRPSITTPTSSSVFFSASDSLPPSPSANSHTFVSPSALGPPSPSSTPTSSPQSSTFNISLSEFAHNFPPIDELEAHISGEGTGVVKPVITESSLKPVNTDSSVKAKSPSSKLKSNLGFGILPVPTSPLTPAASPKTPISPIPSPVKPPINGSTTPYRPFSLSLGLGLDRPSSTPITPSAPAFISRTPSPTFGGLAPKLSRKPSLLPVTSSTTGISVDPHSASLTLTEESPPILSQKMRIESNSLRGHSNTLTITPQELNQYLSTNKIKVLLLDVRPREEFVRERIKTEFIVCVEPGVLKREKVTTQDIEDSISAASKTEHLLFADRDKFELIIVYDSSSTSYLSSSSATPHHISPSIATSHTSQDSHFSPEINTLITLIFINARQKFLQRMPILLIGGLKAWKNDIGEHRILRDQLASDSSGNVLRQPGAFIPSSSLAQNISVTQPPPELSLFITRNITDGATMKPAIKQDFGLNGIVADHQTYASPDHHVGGYMRAPTESTTTSINGSAAPMNGSTRRPAVISRGSSSNPSPTSFASSPLSSSLFNGQLNHPITYPSFYRRSSVQAFSSSYSPTITNPQILPSSHCDDISPPPVAATPSLSSYRRNSHGFDRQESSLPISSNSNTSLRSSTATIVEYPSVLRPPPPVAASPLAERQDNRPRQPVFTPGVQSSSAMTKLPNGMVKPPTIASDYPVTYWNDIQIATTGLKNLGNTCYMNATIQCLSATVPFARFFNDGRWKTAINYQNNLGTKGRMVMAFATILHELWHGDLPYITPFEFRKSMGSHKSLYATSDQQDSQEFLGFLLDGIHEDLNRVICKPTWTKTPAQESELETLLPQIASEQEWMLWQTRNDSIIVDFFQGQLRNRLKCSTCGQTSTTYNAFSLLQLPIPSSRGGKVPLQKCFEAYCNREIMEGDDAWDCPKCKVKRKATKELSLSRLPPILIIHLKRFENNGRFSDKIDTFVEFPLKSLDLTYLMPGPLPSGADRGAMNVISPDDPRTQIPPYRYDLYGVTNHYGNLSSGHYTAFVASRSRWMLCDDSTVRSIDPKQVVNQRAYVLFYKRTKV